jgi:transposase
MKTTKVTIDGTEYNLDLEKAKELKLLSEVWKPVKLGDRFLINGQECVLCCSAFNHIILIELSSGYRITEAVRVYSIHEIIEKEFMACVPRGYSSWSRVEK